MGADGAKNPQRFSLTGWAAEKLQEAVRAVAQDVFFDRTATVCSR